MKRKEITGKVRLCLDFDSPADMMAHIAWNQDNATAYLMDALDETKVGPDHTFILKRRGDRPKEFEIKIENREDTVYFVGADSR